MGKKNKLKATVNRGFATTSIPKIKEKVPEETIEEVANDISDKEIEQDNTQTSSLVFSTKQIKLAKKYEANAWKRLDNVEGYLERIKKDSMKIEYSNLDLNPKLFITLYDWINSKPFLCKSISPEEEEEELHIREEMSPYIYENLPFSQPYNRRVFSSFKNDKDSDRALANFYEIEFYSLKLGFNIESVREALAFIGAKNATLPNILDYMILYEKDTSKVPIAFKSFRAIQQEEELYRIENESQISKVDKVQVDIKSPPPLNGSILEPKYSRDLDNRLTDNEIEKVNATILDNLIDIGDESSDDEYMLDYEISLSHAKLELDNIIYKRLETIVLHADIPVYLSIIQKQIQYLSKRIEKMKSAFYFNSKEAKFHLSELLHNQDYRTYELKNILSPTFDQEVSEAHSVKQAAKLLEAKKNQVEKSEAIKNNKSKAESDEDFELDLDSIFENEADSQSIISPTINSSSTKHQIDLEIPRSWTGKTPKQLLLGFSKSKKVIVNVTTSHEKPFVSKVVVSGKVVSSTLTTHTFFSNYKVSPNSDLDSCQILTSMSTNDFLFDSKNHSENFVSTIALYLLNWVTNTSVLPPAFQSFVTDWIKDKEMSTDLSNNMDLLTRYDFFSLTLNSPKPEGDSNLETNFGAQLLESEGAQGVKKEYSKYEMNIKQNIPYWSRKGKDIKATMYSRIKTKEYKETLAFRTQLPVHGYKSEILDAVYADKREMQYVSNLSSNVILIVGETGCGKTTQIPQLLVEDAIKYNRPCQVLCTQPRRISAISIAERVSYELGDGNNKVGTDGSLVGYQGVLLRRLESDRHLTTLSHLVIDEIQERSLETDFLMIVVRELLKKTENKLKVILMSATIDADQFSKYFDSCPVLKIPGRTFPVEVHYLDSIVEKVNYVLDSESRYSRRDYYNKAKVSSNVFDTKGGKFAGDLVYDEEDVGWSVEIDNLKVSNTTKRTLSKMRLDVINYDLIYQLILFTHTAPDQFPQGSILVFMPGIPEIKILYNLLLSDSQLSDPNKFQILEAHSAIAPEKQSEVFVTPKSPIRKVVLATNIAETGITIPDVTIVIDSGRMKQMSYDKKARVSHLEAVDVAQSNALQRQGRAGRVQPGICFRLYLQSKYDSMIPYQTPEMTRLSLDDLCLRVKVYGYDDIAGFLAKAIYPPPRNAVLTSIAVLQEVGAMTKYETLTALGVQLSKLPVAVYLGKIILFGTLFRCLDPALTIAAILSYKSPFPNFSFDRNPKMEFFTEQCDFLTIYSAYSKWKEEVAKGGISEGAKFCSKHGLSLATLLQLEEIKKQYFNLLIASKLITVSKDEARLKFKMHHELCFTPPSLNLYSQYHPIVKCVLVSGLYPKVLNYSSKDRKFYKLTSDLNVANNTNCKFDESAEVGGGFYGQLYRASNSFNACTATPVQISNTSILNEGSHYRLQPSFNFRYAVYFDLMKTKSVNLNASDISAVTPLPLFLFAKTILPLHALNIVVLDNSIVIKLSPYNLALLIQLRNELKNCLDSLVKNNYLKMEDKFLDKLVTILELEYKG